MATPFTSACGVSVSNNYATTGTVTRAVLGTLTPAQIKALYTDGSVWYERDYLKTQFEMAACGVKRNGWAEWLHSSMKPGLGKLLNRVNMQKGPSLVQPFIMGRQLSVVNVDSWAISAGWANSGYAAASTGPLTATQKALGGASDRIIRVSNPTFMASGFDMDAGWFLEKQRLYILNAKSGAAAHGQWKILASAAASDKSYVDVLITSENKDTTTVDTAPEAGLVLVGINNVNDYESHCQNGANYNPVKHVPFWFQTRRRGRRTSQAYREIYQKLMKDNAYFAEFGDIPEAERNRQDEAQWDRQFVNAFLFGRAISSYQTLDGWASLDSINAVTSSATSVNPGTGGELIGKRANMIGVVDQLKACSGRWKDIQNQAINMNELVDYLRGIYRARKSRTGTSPTEIDLYTDTVTGELLEIGFINLTKAKYGDIIRINIESGVTPWGFEWKRFRVPGIPFAVNVVISDEQDDIAEGLALQDSGDGAIAATGRYIMVLDVGGSIYPAILESYRKKYTVGEIDKLAQFDATYKCAMRAMTEEVNHTSECVTTIVEDPLSSGIIVGVGASTPVTTGKTANSSTSNLY